MAAERNDIGYKSVQLLKKEQLGCGSYGVVCKAKLDELTCAAKIIYTELVVPAEGQGHVSRGKEHRHPVKRFERECEFLSTMKHPNIIQYLGTWTDPYTGQLVLLMELLDSDLTSFLERAPGPIPFHKQINICHDIAMALAFLHSCNIAHRDLSGKNILMIADVRAKVTDFGMATLINQSPLELNRQPSPTTCPGTEVYMPPEALLVSAQRSVAGHDGLEKIDIFSFGVLILQILTGKFPNPGRRQMLVKEKCIQGQNETLAKNIPEITCRKEHIDLVDSKHKLRSMFLECLSDTPRQRPTAKRLCEKIAKCKQCSQYRESMRGQDFEAVPRSHPRGPGLRQRTQNFVQEAQELKYNMALLSKVKEFKDDLHKTIEDKDRTIDEKDLELMQVNEQLRTKTLACEQQTLDLKQMHKLYEKQSKELKQLKEKQVSQEELNSTVRKKDIIIREKEMELQRVNEQMKRKVRQYEQQLNKLKGTTDSEVQVSQMELNTAIAEKDKVIRDKDAELQRVKGQLEKKMTQYEQQTSELKQMKEENKKAVRGRHEKEQELKNASDQLKKLTKQCEQQSDKLKQMTEKLNGPQVPREDFNAAIQKKDNDIQRKELEIRELCEELEGTKEVLRIQAHKNGTCLSDLNFTELQIPPDILEGTSKINRRVSPSEDGNTFPRRPQPNQQNEAPPANATTTAKVKEIAIPADKEGDEWRSLGEISHQIHRKDSEVIVSGNTLYIASERSTTIEAVHTYNLISTSQSGNLPECPKKDYSLAVIDGLLTTIGGSGGSKKLYSLSCEGEGDTSRQRKWIERFPPMPTGRQWTTALCSTEYLIVAGGCLSARNGKIVSVLDNVEILDIKNSQWSIAANLPEPLCLASGAVIHGDMVLIGGGMDKDEKATKSMYSCSLASLVKTSRPIGKPVEFKISMWDRFADLPADWSTCVSVGNSLLAVGGTYQPVDQSEPSSRITSMAMSKVYCYNPASESWDVLSYMLSARSGCFTVKPSKRELMVLGGGDHVVEIAEIIMP